MKKLKYRDIESIIEKLIMLKKNEWKVICTPYEDVAQEIRIFCNRILDKFNVKKGMDIEKYFNICINNFIRNYMRDKHFYYVLPCVHKNCDYYRDNRECINPSGNCSLMKKYLHKKNLYENFTFKSISINYCNDDVMSANELVFNPSIYNSMDMETLTGQISGKLSEKQFMIFNLMSSGYKIMEIADIVGYGIDKNARRITDYHIAKIRKTVRGIMDEYNGE